MECLKMSELQNGSLITKVFSNTNVPKLALMRLFVFWHQGALFLAAFEAKGMKYIIEI